MSEESFGPALPPGFPKKTSHIIGPSIPPKHSSKRSTVDDSSGSLDSDSSSSDSDPEQIGVALPSNIGPALPPNIGPALPPNIGPALPPNIGPALPPNIGVASSPNIGPVLPSGFLKGHTSESDSDSDSGIGPRLPLPGQSTGLTAVQAIEERARKMKHRLIHGTDEDNKPQARESWMTELPSGGVVSKHMGLVARKLGEGSKVKGTDRSVWTDTPEDKARKAQDAAEGRVSKRSHEDAPIPSARDIHMAKLVNKYNKGNRSESLLDMHEKKLKKKKKKEEKKKKKERKKEKKDLKRAASPPTERRPFDRDLDLGVNRFDDAKRKSLIKRSQELNTRFGSGGQKFL